MYTYLLINIFTIAGPIFGSFEKRVCYFSKWKYAVSANMIVGIPFIIWDSAFTNLGVWGFNKKYFLGYSIASLPIEEWLFFITVPFACLLIYETVKTLRNKKESGKTALLISLISGIGLMVTAFIFIHQLYTFIAFLFTGILLLIHALILKSEYLSNFFIAYAISLIPFMIVNGLLTSLPVVWYNDSENFGIRIYTIPIEDTIYSLLLLLGNVTVYEKLKKHLSHPAYSQKPV
jgi:lycopene cyclase domain-containing protein